MTSEYENGSCHWLLKVNALGLKVNGITRTNYKLTLNHDFRYKVENRETLPIAFYLVSKNKFAERSI